MTDKLSDILPSSLSKNNAGRTVRAAMVSVHVEKAIVVAIPATEGNVRCAKIRGGVAHVSATTSVLAEEIRLHEPTILAALVTVVGDGVVTRIRIIA